MKHKAIQDVFTVIYKGRQKVVLNVKGLDKNIYLSSGNVIQCTGVKIDEVEILIGSTIRPKFYKVGEKMFNGIICDREYTIIKDFWIECSGSIAEMKDKNFDKLKLNQRIVEIFQFQKKGKDVIGINTDIGRTTYINSSRLQQLTQLDPTEFHILVGSYINPEYFLEGEKLYGGGTCYKSGVILKALNLRFLGKVEEMYENYENKEPSYSTGHYGNETGYDSSKWLEDAAGSTDPELMNIAYWNMD